MGNLLTHDYQHLDILTSIKIDKTLPKYKNKSNSKPSLDYDYLKKLLSITEETGNISEFNSTVTSTINKVYDNINVFPMSNWVVSGSNNNGETILGDINKRKLWKRVKAFFKRNKKENNENDVDKFDIIKFFSDIHGLIFEEESTRYVNRVSDYIQCIGYAEKAGQVALKEKLIKSLVLNKLESVLYAKGLYRAVTEEAVVKLVYKTAKPLSLTYIENYVRNIPIDVIKKKMEIDELEVFDNYCILHYDENGEAIEDTEEEKERKKDPILFGLINGSNKLYFIADWVDEYCDLTFDKMTEILGKEIVESGFLKDKITI